MVVMYGRNFPITGSVQAHFRSADSGDERMIEIIGIAGDISFF